MTGFSTQWLALREGADFLARDAAVRDAALKYFAHRDEITVVDLACGAGSNPRALAPFLGTAPIVAARRPRRGPAEKRPRGVDGLGRRR